jgi:hypothetical protein
MSTIDKKQGAIKLDEVSVDRAQPVINTLEREDGLTVLERLRRLVTDSFRRNTILLTSSANITWSGGILSIPASVSLDLRLLASPDSSTTAIQNITYSSGSPTNWVLANGDILYIELERSILDLDADGIITLTDGVNGAGTVGRRIRKTTLSGFPFINDLNDGSPQGTLAIPVAHRLDSADTTKINLWWAPHGILWSHSVTGMIGKFTTTTNIPIGGIIPIHIPNITDVGAGPNQAIIDFYAPGFWLCDGSLITNISSPIYNETTPNLNTTVVYQAATVGDYNPIDTGGNKFLKGNLLSNITGGKSQVVLSAATIPAHTGHSSGYPKYPGAPNGYDHTHPVLVSVTDEGSSSTGKWDSTDHTGSTYQITTTTPYVGDPDENIHDHTSGDSPSGGGAVSPNAAPHENQPPYFNAVYIMRVV